MPKKHKKFNRIFKQTARALAATRVTRAISHINRLVTHRVPVKNFFKDKIDRINRIRFKTKPPTTQNVKAKKNK